MKIFWQMSQEGALDELFGGLGSSYNSSILMFGRNQILLRPSIFFCVLSHREALAKLRGREGGAGAERAILLYVGRLQLISTLKIGADCCQLCQYKLT